MPSRSALESPLARRLALSVIVQGGSMQKAGAKLDTTGKAIQRYARKHSDFKAQLELARELASTKDKDAIERLLEAVAPGPVEADELPVEAVAIVPAPVVDAELIDESDPNIIVEGLPPLNERELLAYYWRAIHNPKTASGVVSTCLKALHEHTLMRGRHQRLLQVEGVARKASRSRGLTRETVSEVQRTIIGPRPDAGERAA